MGIVIEQSVKNTLSTYLGFAIGALNTLVFYTHFMNASNYGIVSLLLSIATLSAPFLLVGSQQLLIRYYPDFSDKNSIISLSLLIPILMSILIGIGLMCFQHQLINFIQSDSNLPRYFLWYIFFIAVSMAFFEYFYALSRVAYKTVSGNFLKEVAHRLLIAFGLVAYFYEFLTFNGFMLLLVMIYALRMIVMFTYSLLLVPFKLSLSFSFSIKPLLIYALVLFMGSVAALIILEVDKIMIHQYLDLRQVAYYTVGVFIATLVAVPYRAMHQITLPITAKFIADKNEEGLKNLYKQSSINLCIVTGLVLVLLLVNIDALYSFLPEDYHNALWVVYILGIAKFIDASLGINNAIVTNASFYAYVLGFGMLLGIMTVVFNMWLLPRYGVEGAAYASLIALTIYNLLKLMLVLINFKMHPYSWNTLLVILLSASVYFTVNQLVSVDHVEVDILVKSGLTLILYVGITYKLKLSLSVNQLIHQLFKKV